MNTKFYTFSQNNSGGYFDVDDSKGIGHYVIIEAVSEDDAILRAEEIGLHFDGFGDCPCCGNRWSSYCEESDRPEIYGVEYAPTNEQTRVFIHNFGGDFSYGKEKIEH
jgi:hypothetical protein